MSRQVRRGDGQIEISIVGNTVGVGVIELGTGAGLELVIHGPTVTKLIKSLSNVVPPYRPHLQEVLR